MPRLTIQDMHALAQRRRGKCLSIVYSNAHAKLAWRCARGHEWTASVTSVRNGGTWCPTCAGHKPLTLNDMISIARSKGGKCLSKKYVNNSSNLGWRCAQGHTWEATPSNISKTNGTWCPWCAGVGPRNLEQMMALARERGGFCLSKKYVNLRTKLWWRCKNNHEFRIAPGHAIHRNQWCSLCTKFVSERICRGVFETLFQKKFPKTRPNWLTTGRNERSELDGYCAQLGLAFEYHGEQHYRRVRHFHRRASVFVKRRTDDLRKMSLCRARGVQLVVVPYSIKYNSMEVFIREQARKLGVHVPRRTRVDWKKLPKVYDPGSLTRMQQVARRQGGECLSTVYINNSTKLKWRCAKGHEWKAVPSHISLGGWCPQCRGKNNPRNLEMMKDLAKKRGGRCLSKIYRRNEAKLKWSCAEGHIWLAPPSGIIGGRWCPVCGGSSRYTLRNMRKLAESKDGKCLSRNYVNNHTKLRWRCAEGHDWEAVPSSIKFGGWCPRCAQLRRNDHLRLTIGRMHDFARKRRGECLSKTYINNHTKLRWRCAEGHTWQAMPGKIQQGRWCPDCKRVHLGDSQRLSIADMHKLASKRGGKCLSQAYKNANTKLEWGCVEGHTWWAVPNSIQQGSWCPTCREPRTSKHEMNAHRV
jgi:hypothetical protein